MQILTGLKLKEFRQESDLKGHLLLYFALLSSEVFTHVLD